VNERLLKTLLHDFFCVLTVTSEPPGGTQNPCLMAPDKHFKRFVAPTRGSSN
jgi:hypothetical protein